MTDAVDAWHDSLASKGVDVLDPPRENAAYGIYHFFFRDPNGYLFEVQRFLRPDWDHAPA